MGRLRGLPYRGYVKGVPASRETVTTLARITWKYTDAILSGVGGNNGKELLRRSVFYVLINRSVYWHYVTVIILFAVRICKENVEKHTIVTLTKWSVNHTKVVVRNIFTNL